MREWRRQFPIARSTNAVPIKGIVGSRRVACAHDCDTLFHAIANARPAAVPPPRTAIFDAKTMPKTCPRAAPSKRRIPNFPVRNKTAYETMLWSPAAARARAKPAKTARTHAARCSCCHSGSSESHGVQILNPWQSERVQR